MSWTSLFRGTAFGFNPHVIGLGWTFAAGTNLVPCTNDVAGVPPTAFTSSPYHGYKVLLNGRPLQMSGLKDTMMGILRAHAPGGGGSREVDPEIGKEPSRFLHPFQHSAWASNKAKILARRSAVMAEAKRQEETRLRDRLIARIREIWTTRISPFADDVESFDREIQSGHLFVADKGLRRRITDVATTIPSLRDAMYQIEHRLPKKIHISSLLVWIGQITWAGLAIPAILQERRNIRDIQRATAGHISRLSRFLNVPATIAPGEALAEASVIMNLRPTFMDFDDPDRMDTFRNAILSTGRFSELLSLVERYDETGSGFTNPWGTTGSKISDATKDLTLFERYIAFIFVGATIGIHPRSGDGITAKDGEGRVLFVERVSDSRMSARWIRQTMKVFNLSDKFTTWDGETALEDPLTFGSANRAWISSNPANPNEPYARIVDIWLYHMIGALEHDPRTACDRLREILSADRELTDLLAAEKIPIDDLKARCAIPAPHTNMPLVRRIMKPGCHVNTHDRHEAMVKYAIDANRHSWLSLENVAPIALEMHRADDPRGRTAIVNYPYRIVHADTPIGLVIGLLRVVEGRSMVARTSAASYIDGAKLEAALYRVDPETWNTAELMREFIGGRSVAEAESFNIPASISEGNRAVMETVPEVVFDGGKAGLRFQVAAGLRGNRASSRPSHRTIEIFSR